MLPANLTIDSFAAYPPLSRGLVATHQSALRRIPLTFLPSLLREVIEYDYKFPAERASLEKELRYLSSLSIVELDRLFAPFSAIPLSEQLLKFDWINHPSQFLEQQSAYLWSTHQVDAFRKAATDYGDHLQSVLPPERLAAQRLGISIIGQGVTTYDAPLFRYLRKHGTFFSHLKPANGLEMILASAAQRAKTYAVSHGHWYIDGATAASHDPSLLCVSYGALETLRSSLLKMMQRDIARPGMGPEELRTHLARLQPQDVDVLNGQDPIMDRFELRLFTEGSGTQMFSTTFAQWATREALRRAQPLTLVTRFAPRQRQRPMNEMISSVREEVEYDPAASLVDADMAAYYHWLNQQRLPGAEQSAFVVWFEGHGHALAIAPSLPRNTASDSSVDLEKLIELVTS